jgi:hypothetical protein
MKRSILAAWSLLLVLCLQPIQAAVVDTYPLVVRADHEAAVTLVFENEPKLAQNGDIFFDAICADGLAADGSVLPGRKGEALQGKIDGATVTITAHFRGETEHTLRVLRKTADPKKPEVLGIAKVYSVKPDYFALRPYRGNVHMHSKFSDGDKNETPAMMVATCRKLGHDFAIETDHRTYAGSLSAIEDLGKLPTDMKTFPGEEVHSPGNGVHILSLGASQSITDWFTKNPAEYDAAVAAEKAKLPNTLAEELKHPVAASYVIWDKIRSLGGIAVFAHPYWRPTHRQYIPTVMSDFILQTAKFDAMEILNGGSSDLGILKYHEMRAAGQKIAGIGVTDAHSSRHLEPAHTFILAEELTFPALAKNIRLRNCAAVDIDPKSKRHTVIGEFRFSRYAIFLNENFYPKQDDLCAKEGEWLLKALAGDAGAVESLKKSQGTTPNLRVKYWQK